MGWFNDMMIEFGFAERPRVLRGKDRRRLDRRYERLSGEKGSSIYQERLKKDRRKKERRK